MLANFGVIVGSRILEDIVYHVIKLVFWKE